MVGLVDAIIVKARDTMWSRPQYGFALVSGWSSESVKRCRRLHSARITTRYWGGPMDTLKLSLRLAWEESWSFWPSELILNAAISLKCPW